MSIVHIKPWRLVGPMRKSLGGNALATPIRGELPATVFSITVHPGAFFGFPFIISGLLDLFFLRGVGSPFVSIFKTSRMAGRHALVVPALKKHTATIIMAHGLGDR